MRKKLIAVFAFVGVCVSPALAEDSYENCKAFSAANGLDPAPCTCIAENVGDDADLLAEQAALETMEDFAGASAELRDAINACL
jgi:hypothetical protein